MRFTDFFQKLTSLPAPHPWQARLGEEEKCGSRLIRIPTGFGKTFGVIAPWLWHRVVQKNDSWPRRLLWCLPMRVLVEQTEQEVRTALSSLDLLRDGTEDHAGKTGVHLLMGGADAGEWHLYPEECAVLIGTQDMLLSRAMNRGYACPRARWPMEFGLLNQDCLWVMDEVQLMGVGLATSIQLQAFRDQDAASGRLIRPAHTWWMSATLQPDWLKKSPDAVNLAENTVQTAIPAAERTGPLWEGVRKPCRRETVSSETAAVRLIAGLYEHPEEQPAGPVLVIANTVDRAVEIRNGLLEHANGMEVRLIHSRFRPAERSSWREEFLSRDSCGPEARRMIVSTQVVEAGVDISAAVLITELAPWASLVQRFGRCARWGGAAQVIVLDFSPKDDKAAAPYTKDELDAAREALSLLDDVSPMNLEVFEASHPDLLPRLYPFHPPHLLLRHELDELFDATPDLSGADIDISRFIREGDERDVRVFWEEIPPEKDTPPAELRPMRDALCAVPFLKARDWLCGKSQRLKKNMRAWVWDWLDGKWKAARKDDLLPGRTVLVDAACGGYHLETGWDPDCSDRVAPTDRPAVSPAVCPATEDADGSLDNDGLSVREEGWQTIATHGMETARLAGKITDALCRIYTPVFQLAARRHDVGKAHPAFCSSILSSIDAPGRPDRVDIAKAPARAWAAPGRMYAIQGEPRRKGFRHELVSVLSLMSVLQAHAPDHAALLGPWRDMLAAAGLLPASPAVNPAPPNAADREVMSLTGAEFNLAAWLIGSHHGKLRLAWHSSPADQAADDGVLRIAGVREGDKMPPVPVFDAEASLGEAAGFTVDLSAAAAGLNPATGMGWTERILRLLERHGPFTLAWMEAIFRAADQRASRLAVMDELLQGEDAK